MLALELEQFDGTGCGRRDQCVQAAAQVQCAQDPDEIGELGGFAGFEAFQRAFGNAGRAGKLSLALVVREPMLTDAAAQLDQYRSIR